MSNDEDSVSLAIKNVVKALMDRVMTRVLEEDPFIEEEHHAKKPLYAALVPDEIFKGSHFERRFVTPFGGVWEKLTVVVAEEFHQNCIKGHEINGFVGKESLRRIQEALNKLEKKNKDGGTSPDWENELKYILEGGGELIPTKVICDIFIDSKRDSKKYAFELKGPLPNSDQTKVSKEKMFKLLAMSPKVVDFAFFALPYNPYGKKEDYAWSFPMRWFNMKKDESVLIGNEFWDLVGGNGTYQKFITEINKLGSEYKKTIYKDYLGIEPPKDFNQSMLK